MNRNLLILGAGGYGTVVKELALEMGSFQKIDFLDDRYGAETDDYHEEAIGKISDMESFVRQYSFAVIAIGNPEVRINLLRRIEEETPFIVPVLISPRAYVSPSAHIQKGAVIEPLAGVHANTIIGKASYISMGAVVNHNAIISEGCHIDIGAAVMSGAFVKPKTEVEACTVIRREMLCRQKRI